MVYFEKLKIQEQYKKRRRTANIMFKTLKLKNLKFTSFNSISKNY